MHQVVRSTVSVLLSGAACGVVAVAVAIGNGGAAQAANGDPVRLGLGNMASAGTNISTTFGGLSVTTTDQVGAAVSGAGNQYGLFGTTEGGDGVYGISFDSGRAGAGVYGENAGDAFTGGSGVVGIATNNIGVSAISAKGTALSVSGVATFTRSGMATVPAGARKIVIGGVALSDASMILALTQQAGAPAVRAAVPDAANGRFTIYLSKPATTKVVVAWFVLS
jgi:hypothetical protein